MHTIEVDCWKDRRAMTRQARGSQEKEGREKNRKPEVIWDHLGSSGKSLKALGSLPGSPWEDFGSGKALG